MNSSLQFPNDGNGDVLRRMDAAGDDLTQARMIDFCFVFPERRQVLAFAGAVDDLDIEVCISYFAGRKAWQAIVKRHMVPDYTTITATEAALTVKADSAGGKADGWGCMRVQRKD